jgi:vacuolar-type H+-ATPase subunit H
MNEVITKLDDIEKRAGAILSDAKSRKEQLMRDLEKDKRAIDAEYEKKEQKSVEDLKAKRRNEAEGQFSQLEKSGREAIDKLNALYEEQGEKLADDIFKRIVSSGGAVHGR